MTDPSPTATPPVTILCQVVAPPPCYPPMNVLYGAMAAHAAGGQPTGALPQGYPMVYPPMVMMLGYQAYPPPVVVQPPMFMIQPPMAVYVVAAPSGAPAAAAVPAIYVAPPLNVQPNVVMQPVLPPVNVNITPPMNVNVLYGAQPPGAQAVTPQFVVMPPMVHQVVQPMVMPTMVPQVVQPMVMPPMIQPGVTPLYAPPLYQVFAPPPQYVAVMVVAPRGGTG